MAEVKFTRKSKIEIDSTPVEDGQILFSTDTPEIFMDDGEERKEYGGSGSVDAYTKQESDEKFATKQEIPTELPNPNALTFTGAVNDTYDGTEEKTINIPQASEAQNGIPTGGTTGQVLAKKTDSDYDVEWKDEVIVSSEQVETAVNKYLTENPVSGGISETAQSLLISILKSALYTENQTEKISELEIALAEGSGNEGLTKYTITYNLSNSISSNKIESIYEGRPYSTSITPLVGYILTSVKVFMNDEDITSTSYSDGNINIDSVTGNIVITVETTQESITMLKSINLSNGSYVDTEYIPENIDCKYLIGVQSISENWKNSFLLPFAGVDRLPSSTIDTEEYMRIHFICDDSLSSIKFGIGAYKNPSVTEVKLSTGQESYGNCSLITETPFYAYYANGEQKIKANEELTEDLQIGTFPTASLSTQFSTNAAMPIDSIYLGKVNSAGSKKTDSYTDGIKVYCFKVYDSLDKLVVDMHPALQSGKIGMYDNVRNKFYASVGEDVSYDEME